MNYGKLLEKKDKFGELIEVERKEGEGLFGMYGENGANLAALIDGWRENIVLGFIGGAVPGYFFLQSSDNRRFVSKLFGSGSYY